MGKNQFVVKRGNAWAVVGANNSRATRITNTQAEAIKIAKKIAKKQNSQLRVQNRNNHFRVCNSYGNDPCPPIDKNY